MITLFVAGGALAAWIYLVALHGRFWQSGPELEERAPAHAPHVAVVIPARDEAESIATSLTSLLAQHYSGPLDVILVDDNSSDGTGAIARALPHNDRLTVIDGAPLAAGWSGKLWAVHQGLQQSAARSASYILLTDADITHEPTHVARLVAKAEADNLDMVSEMVRLHCATFAERALIPAFIYFFQMLYPFAWVNNAQRGMAGAAGGTILIRRAALERIGGVESIRRALIDDCALAAQVRNSGGRLWLATPTAPSRNAFTPTGARSGT